MAEANFGAQYSEPSLRMGAGPVQTLLNILGAVVSLALILGIVIWGYQLLVRDVSGVPVVRALDGPMRVVPDDPGGRPAMHQGLSVNDVAEDGAIEVPTQQVVLAPQSLTLADEDQPLSALQEAALNASPAAPLAPSESATATPVVEVAPLAEDGSIDILALADQLAAGGNVFTELSAPQADETPVLLELAPMPTSPTETAAAPEAPVAVQVQAGLRRSQRPVLRVARAQATQAAVQQAAPASLDLDPASVPAGTRVVQLGAFDSPEVARSEWARLETRFSDYMDGKQRIVMKAASGGRTFYRLRAVGFADLSDARRFCSTLVAQNAACIPVVTR